MKLILCPKAKSYPQFIHRHINKLEYTKNVRHTYKTKGVRLFGYPEKRSYGDKPSDRGRFLIRMAKWAKQSNRKRPRINLI